MSKPRATAEILHQSGLRLKLIRVIRDADAKEWCQELGVLQTRWSSWENGAHAPEITVMARAADLYGFSLDWIFRGVASTLPEELAREVRRRRPDLIVGASSDAQPSPDWDFRPGAIPRWRRGPKKAA